MQSISPNYNWENWVKQIRLLKKIFCKSCILYQLLRTKTLALESKCIKYFFYFYHSLPYICCAEGMWFISHVMSFLNLLKLMASLDILCFNPFICNLKNKIFKIEQKKIFRGPSKILKSISWPINICLKYFMAPTKTIRPPPPPPPPTYLLLHKLRSLNWKNHMKS